MKKAISVYVDEEDYGSLKTMAHRQRRPVAELVREAMAEYVTRERGTGRPLLDIPPRELGRQLRPWSRDEVFREMSSDRVGRSAASERGE